MQWTSEIKITGLQVKKTNKVIGRGKIMQMDKLSTGNLVWYSNKATWNERDKKISLRRRHLYVKNIHNLHGSSKTVDECKYMYIFMAVKNIWS